MAWNYGYEESFLKEAEHKMADIVVIMNIALDIKLSIILRLCLTITFFLFFYAQTDAQNGVKENGVKCLTTPG